MSKKITFIARDDLAIIEGEETIVLRKGFLHVNEVSIDKKESSKGFLNLFRELATERSLSLTTENEYYDDFMKLVHFRLLDIKVQNDSIVIIDDVIYELLAPLFTASCVKVSECLTEDLLKHSSEAYIEKIFLKNIFIITPMFTISDSL